jgi:protease IV
MTFMEFVGRTALVATVLFILIFISVWGSLQIYGTWHDEWSGYNSNQYVSNGMCNVARLQITGDIIPYTSEEASGTSGDDVRNFLHFAERDSNIVAVIATVDSYGGAPAAGETIATEFKMSPLPVVAYIRESAASAAYLAVSGSDAIAASPFADVGSIGVTMSYLDNTVQNANEGLSYVSLTSAPYKDYASPDRPMLPAERALIERDLKVWHDEFVKQVAANRKLDVAKVAALADGSSLPGVLAKEAGLVDYIGGEAEVLTELSEWLDIPVENLVICD